MPTEVPYQQYASKALETISKGAFLTAAAGGQSNTMTIGWGAIGPIWGLPVFTVLVRKSRYTYQFIDNSDAFTVSIPWHDMQAGIALCGTKSGRDIDKIATAGLTLAPGQKVAVPVIAGCGLQYECEIIYKTDMAPNRLASAVQQQFYKSGDYHTIYYGKIVACYLDVE